MLALHDLAARYGDGLKPELLSLLRDRGASPTVLSSLPTTV
ncbi:MAG: hypothetical protein AAGF48_15155 [Pseudomonadota bacterium]